jgi:hypothetical protein
MAQGKEPTTREPSPYHVYEVVDRPRQMVAEETGEESIEGGPETLKLVETLQATSSADADRQWRSILEDEFRVGGRSGEVEYRCIAARFAEPLYYAGAQQKMVVTGGTR